MPKYQVQYKNNSKTFNDIIEASSEAEIKSLFVDLINSEITEIKEILYENPYYPKDDGDYIKSVSCLLRDDNKSMYSLRIPKVKKTISDSELQNSIKTYIKINSKTPKSLQFTHNF